MFAGLIRGTFVTPRLAAGFLAAAWLTIAPAVAPGQPAVKGQWGPVLQWPNVGIHLHVLPDGKVMYWSRREPGETLDAKDIVPRLWDPATGQFSELARPGYNIFCGGHALLPDGRVVVARGPITATNGLPTAIIYDP